MDDNTKNFIKNEILEQTERVYHEHNKATLNLLRELKDDIKEFRKEFQNKNEAQDILANSNKKRIDKLEEIAIKADTLVKFFNTATSVNEGINWFSDFSWKLVKIFAFFFVVIAMMVFFVWGKIKSVL